MPQNDPRAVNIILNELDARATAAEATAAKPTLAALTLAANAITENAASGTVVGGIVGKTAGSTLSLASDDGGRFAISGTNLVAGLTTIDYEAGASRSIVLRETLAGATNSPRDTPLAVGVVNVNEQPSLRALLLSSTSLTVGTAASGTITEAATGSAITASGQPAGFTINGPARTWAYDGSGPAGSATVTLTETLGDSPNSPRATQIGLTVTGVPVTPGEPTSSGLLLRDAGTMSGWANDGTTWSSISAPATIPSARSPIVAQAPSISGSEAGGIREGFLYEDSDGVWYIFYGAGNGSVSDAGGPWRPQYSRSTDRGLTWTKMGQLSPGLSKGYDATNWAAVDMLFLDKRGTRYYLHRLTAATVSNNQVCGQPYTSDVWSAATPGGTYTYEGRTVESGASGSPDQIDAYASCMVLKDGVYHLFYSSTSSGNDYNCGLSTGPSPTGPFTKVNPALIPASIKMQPENPEVYFDTQLNKWVMLVNQVNKTRFVTDRNRAFYSDSLTDWSNCTYNELQLLDTSDGDGAIGMARIKRAPDNSPQFDKLGNYGVIYDADPKPGFGLHTGRSLFYSQLEPSPAGMVLKDSVDFSSFTVGDLGGQQGWVDRSGSAAKPRIIASGSTNVLDMRASVGPSAASRSTVVVPARDARYVGTGRIGNQSGFGFGFGYKVGTAHIRVDIGRGTTDLNFTVIYVNSAGTETNLSSLKVDIGSATVDFDYDIALSGNIVTVKINQILRMTFEITDATHIAAANKDGDVFVRNGFGGSTERTIRALAVMPASGAALSTTHQPNMRTLSHTRLSAEFGLLLGIGALAFVYRTQSATSADNGYAIAFSTDSSGKLVVIAYSMVGGVATPIGTGTGTLVPVAKAYLRVRVVVEGSSHKVIVDGKPQLDFTDSQYASGTGVGFRAATDAAYAELRNVTFRKSDTVTINGLTTGDKVTLRGASGIPLATATATGASLALTYQHFPAAVIDVNGTPRFTPNGGVWGGDVYG